MAFITGLLLIDAPASALNNMGQAEGTMTDNTVAVKYIRTKEGAYPYVSAQAFRYWLRSTLEKGPWEWQSAPVYREQKIAYTDADPIKWWDDDLFGYMRAPSKKVSAAAERAGELDKTDLTPVTDTITRISPLRVSTLVSLAPVHLVNDYGVMARQEGDPVPYEHQFYRTTLYGLFSLDLHAAGTFSYRSKTGYLNLDQTRIEEARQKGLEELKNEKAFRLPLEERITRISALLQGLACLEGGAKQAVHYTDVSPDLVLVAITRGGNHIFGHVIGANEYGKPVIKTDAFKEALTVYADDILSHVYVGWVQGYLDKERHQFISMLENEMQQWNGKIIINHPREIFKAIIEEFKKHPDWLD